VLAGVGLTLLANAVYVTLSRLDALEGAVQIIWQAMHQ
jgi:hypothetical protein